MGGNVVSSQAAALLTVEHLGGTRLFARLERKAGAAGADRQSTSFGWARWRLRRPKELTTARPRSLFRTGTSRSSPYSLDYGARLSPASPRRGFPLDGLVGTVSPGRRFEMMARTTKATSSAVSREQCRKARAWLAWTPRQLALRARVSDSTVLDYEAGKRTPIERNLRAITRALEAAGLSFESGGIAIKKPAKRRLRNVGAQATRSMRR
jgi:hypothetical protein